MIHAFTGRYGNADEATVRKLHGEGERAALPAVFLANIYRTYTWKSEVPPISLIGPMRFRCTRRPPAWLQAEFFEVRSAVRPSAVSVGIADRILAHIAINFGEPVLTLHLRRGDFGAVCDGALTLCSVCVKSAFQCHASKRFRRGYVLTYRYARGVAPRHLPFHATSGRAGLLSDSK